jgi:hypothetical protein
MNNPQRLISFRFLIAVMLLDLHGILRTLFCNYAVLSFSLFLHFTKPFTFLHLFHVNISFLWLVWSSC